MAFRVVPVDLEILEAEYIQQTDGLLRVGAARLLFMDGVVYFPKNPYK